MNDNSNFKEWIESLSQFNLPDWNQMPDLDLYMDQVITILDRELKAIKVDENNIITAPMINNYVKAALLPAPDKKKYNKRHLAYLFVVLSLKQVLSISDIDNLIKNKMGNDDENEDAYLTFSKLVNQSIENVLTENASSLDELEISDDNLSEVYSVIAKLAITAQINKIIADKILYFVEKSKQQKNKEKELQDKLEKFEKEETLKRQKDANVKIKAIKLTKCK